jgi:hypothetical protein
MRGTRKKILGEKLMREYIKTMFGNATAAAFPKILIFFLLKLNMVCMFWIVLKC